MADKKVAGSAVATSTVVFRGSPFSSASSENGSPPDESVQATNAASAPGRLTCVLESEESRLIRSSCTVAAAQALSAKGEGGGPANA